MPEISQGSSHNQVLFFHFMLTVNVVLLRVAFLLKLRTQPTILPLFRGWGSDAVVQIGRSEVTSSNPGEVRASASQPSDSFTSLAHKSAQRTSQTQRGEKDRYRDQAWPAVNPQRRA